MIHPQAVRDFIYLQFQEKGPLRFPNYFDGVLSLLKRSYPDVRLHLLTNLDEVVPGFTVHCQRDLPRNHLARLRVFGLLDRPAIHLDQDVCILKPFTSWHLAGPHPFKYYTRVSSSVLEMGEGSPSFESLYNGGVIWIPRPDRAISLEMESMAWSFSNWPHAHAWGLDDAVASYYCHVKGISFDGDPSVNRLVYGEYPPILEAQSLHFIGADKNRLNAFLRDHHAFDRS